MELNNTELLYMILYSFLSGIGSGIGWDLLKAFRKLFGIDKFSTPSVDKKFKNPMKNFKILSDKARTVLGNIFLTLGDILFCVLSGIVISVLMFYNNHGEFRWFVVGAFVLGLLIYKYTVETPVVIALDYVVFIIKEFVLYLIFVAIKPIVCFRDILKKTTKKLKEKKADGI